MHLHGSVGREVRGETGQLIVRRTVFATLLTQKRPDTPLTPGPYLDSVGTPLMVKGMAHGGEGLSVPRVPVPMILPLGLATVT